MSNFEIIKRMVPIVMNL